jgi:hypothetical protein|nr:MAG TPA: hypothetical protein [Caudoviricetes sp.]DAY21813.1 MAG TPA: hypothetical protein [Caudoviricetes sp.]
MEIKLIIEIEEGSRPVIENFSKAIMSLGNNNIIKGEAVIERITSDIQERKSSEANIKADPVKDEKLKGTKEEKVELPKAVAPKLTLEQLRAGCVEGSGLGKGLEIKKLLNEKYEVKKLDALSDERYLDFANDLRELGVRI